MIKRDSPTSVDCPIRYVFSFDTGEDCRQTLDFSVVAFLKSRVVGVAWYSVLVPPYEYGVVVGGFLVNISGGKEKARHIFINAAGCCEIVPRCSVVGAAGRQSEVRKGRGAWSVRRLGCAFFSCQQFNGFGEALAEKLHDKINGAAAFALAVPVPFVSPDSQAVVPLPAVFISGTGKLLAL